MDEAKVMHLVTFLKDKFDRPIRCYNQRSADDPLGYIIYNKDKVMVLHDGLWDYIEIFGLTDEEFECVKDIIAPPDDYHSKIGSSLDSFQKFVRNILTNL